MLRLVARWAMVNHFKVALAEIDLNPYAVGAAPEFSANACKTEWPAGDMLSYAHAVATGRGYYAECNAHRNI